MYKFFILWCFSQTLVSTLFRNGQLKPIKYLKPANKAMYDGDCQIKGTFKYSNVNLTCY